MGQEQIEEGEYFVICQKWEEKERGWGSRPDGFSLHISEDDRAAFVQAYWDSMPDHVPEEYETPDGYPYGVGVSYVIYAELLAVKSLRFAASYKYPGNGGYDGWR